MLQSSAPREGDKHKMGYNNAPKNIRLESSECSQVLWQCVRDDTFKVTSYSTFF